MKPLKANILDKLAESATLDFYNGDHSHAGTLTIPLKEDAQLFMEVYRDFNRFPVEDAVARHVYLVAGRMIARNVEMKRLVLRQLQYHINQYPDAVAHRIFDTLMIFDLSELVPPLKEVLQSRSFPAT